MSDDPFVTKAAHQVAEALYQAGLARILTALAIQTTQHLAVACEALDQLQEKFPKHPMLGAILKGQIREVSTLCGQPLMLPAPAPTATHLNGTTTNSKTPHQPSAPATPNTSTTTPARTTTPTTGSSPSPSTTTTENRRPGRPRKNPLPEPPATPPKETEQETREDSQ